MKFRIDKNSDWTLFLDRDGVINERNFDGYITSYDDFIFRTGSLEALSKFSQFFKRIIVITNQQCIAKGMVSEKEVELIHEKMCKEVSLNRGRIDAIFVAKEFKNHHPYHRKPNSTLGFIAKNKFKEIQFDKSIMVGDTDTDIRFGQNLGMKTVLVKSKEKTILKADIEIDNLMDLCANLY